MTEQVISPHGTDPNLDQLFGLDIDQDGLKAYMIFHPPTSQYRFTYEQVITFCEAAGIKYGLDYGVIRQFAEAPQGYVGKKILVAEGISPLDGEDGFVQYEFQKAVRTGPKKREDGRVDFHTVREIANVKQGQLLATLEPATKGIPGKSVLGAEIPAKHGKEARLKPGKNVVITAERNAVYATIDGQVTVMGDGKINVFPVFEVKGDLDFDTGNIDFVGTVVIRGNVPTGFSVKADGDIRILGEVEGAVLEAQGSIEIKNGIVGNHKGLVKAGENVLASFMHEANVEAGQDVLVKQSIMHSRVYAERRVKCTQGKGLIVGGEIRAGEEIEARTIGNEMTTVTVLEVGSHPHLRTRSQEIEEELRNVQEQLDKVEKALVILQRMMQQHGSLPPEKQQMQIQLAKTKLVSEKRIQELQEEYQQLTMRIEQVGNASISVYNTMYPGTRLVFGKYIRYINNTFQNVRFYLNQNEVDFEPLRR